GSGSDAGADAGRRRLQTLVRLRVTRCLLHGTLLHPTAKPRRRFHADSAGLWRPNVLHLRDAKTSWLLGMFPRDTAASAGGSAVGIGVIRDLFAVLLTIALDAKAEVFENADRRGILHIGRGGTLAKLILSHAIGQHGARHLGAKALPPK